MTSDADQTVAKPNPDPTGAPDREPADAPSKRVDGDIDDREREALVTIARGGIVTSGGISAQRALITAAEALLARGLGPTAYGVYAIAWRIADILTRLVTFGSVPTLQRYLPAYTRMPEQQSRVAGLAYATTIGFGLALFSGLWLAAPWIGAVTVAEPTFPVTMRLFGLAVVAIGIVMIYAGLFRAVGSAGGEVLFNKLLRPVARLMGAVGAIALGYSVVGVAGAIVACLLAVAVLGFPLATHVTDIRPSLRVGRADTRRFYNYAGPVAMSSFGKVFQNRVDVLLVGALLTATGAGVYNAVLVLVAITWIPLRSFNQLLPPVASELYSNDRVGTLNAVYSSVTRLVVTAVLPFLAVQLVFGQKLLTLFGPAYTEGYVPLVVYLIGVFVGSSVGATGWLLMMTDHQYAQMVLDWLLAVSNVALTYLFVVEFGLVGAALGTSLAIAIQNALQALLLRRFEGLWPYDRTFLTPLGGGLVMIVTMWTVGLRLEGFVAVVVGTILGIGAYVGTMVVLGIDRRDRFLVHELAGHIHARSSVDWRNTE